MDMKKKNKSISRISMSTGDVYYPFSVQGCWFLHPSLCYWSGLCGKWTAMVKPQTDWRLFVSLFTTQVEFRIGFANLLFNGTGQLDWRLETFFYWGKNKFHTEFPVYFFLIALAKRHFWSKHVYCFKMFLININIKEFWKYHLVFILPVLFKVKTVK